MSDKFDQTGDPGILENTATLKGAEKKKSPREKAEGEQVQRRGHLKQSELAKWTIFVRPEVKIAVQKAAKKSGITDTAWLDAALWEAAKESLSRKSQPPAKPEDVADIVKQFTDSLKADQKASREAQDEIVQQQNRQIEALRQTVEAAMNKPQPNILQMIFGSKKGI